MASIGSSLLPSASSVSAPAISNFPMAAANTEYVLTIPLGVKNLVFQNRNEGVVKIATSPGASGSVYLTLFPGIPYSIDTLAGNLAVSLYVQSTKPNQVLEILAWS